MVRVAAVLALVLMTTAPSVAQPRKNKPVCVKVYDQGVGWIRICAP
jgi:ABC-type sugar transport system substrate-binding protein